MAHIAKLGALTDELVTLITLFSSQNEPNKFNLYRETSLRNLRHHTNARTNQFEVAQQLDGLEEKFRVYNEDPLADALRSRLDELATRSTKWIPEILHLLLELSDKPVFKSKLSNLELLKPPEVEVEPKLRWEDFAAEDHALREKRIWRNIDYAAESSDDEDASFESNLSDSGETQTTELSIFEEHEGNLLETVAVPTNDEALSLLLKAQFWTKNESVSQDQETSKRNVPTSRVTELQAVREILFMVLGSPTSLFRTGEAIHSLKPVQDFELEHTSPAAFQAILRDLANQGSALLRLRTWTKQDQKLPLIQCLQSATEKRLRSFDKLVSELQAAYVSPGADVVVSLLEVRAELNQAMRPLLELSKIISELESEPYAHAFRYLELLYNKVCISQMAGEEELYEFMGTLFFECFSVYLRPLRRWMEEGEVKRDDKVFFVTENIHEVEPALSWEEKFMLRRTPNGSLHAPRFLHTSANRIFTTGKSVVVLKKLQRFDIARGSRTAVEPTLDFDTVCASKSLSLAPFSELFDVAFEQWVRSKHHSTSSLLRECLYKNCGLWTSLNNLENLYFMKIPTAFPTTIFEKLDQLRPTWNDRFTLTELARTTIGSLMNFDPDRLSAIIHPTKYNDVQQDRKTVISLSSITLLYRLPWAIQMIITPATITVYQNIHTFLLQTLRAQTILSSLPLRAPLTAPTRFSTTTPTQSLHYSLRSRLLWFTNLLTTHLTTNILQPSTTALSTALATAKDVDEMITVHKNFAKKIEDQALLGRKLEPIHETIIKILDLAVRLKDLQDRFQGLEDRGVNEGYRFEYSSGEVRATPVKQKSTIIFTPGRGPYSGRKKRRDSLSDSSNSSDSESDEDDEGNEKSMLSNRGTKKTRVAEDEDGYEGTYLEQLKRMKEDFSRMCRFVSTGLRGVARVGGEGGMGNQWDVLAEMIEGGFDDV